METEGPLLRGPRRPRGEKAGTTIKSKPRHSTPARKASGRQVRQRQPPEEVSRPHPRSLGVSPVVAGRDFAGVVKGLQGRGLSRIPQVAPRVVLCALVTGRRREAWLQEQRPCDDRCRDRSVTCPYSHSRERGPPTLGDTGCQSPDTDSGLRVCRPVREPCLLF